MALELKQQVRLSQQLVMTPQLQQAIKLLQLSRLELVKLVQQEMEENPVLEETLEEEDRAAAEVGAERCSRGGRLPRPPRSRRSPSSSETPRPADDRGDRARSSRDIDWEDYHRREPQTGLREARAATTTGPRSRRPHPPRRRWPTT